MTKSIIFTLHYNAALTVFIKSHLILFNNSIQNEHFHYKRISKSFHRPVNEKNVTFSPFQSLLKSLSRFLPTLYVDKSLKLRVFCPARAVLFTQMPIKTSSMNI